MPSVSAAPDPDDFFSDTRMSIGDHIEDLRAHLLRALYGFLIGMAGSLLISPYVTGIIAAPVEKALQEYQQRSMKTRIEKKRQELGPLGIRIPIKLVLPRDPLRAGIGLEAEDEAVLSTVSSAFLNLFRDLKVPLPPELEKETRRERSRGPLIEMDAEISNPEIFLSSIQPLLIPSTLKTFNVMEAMFVYFKVSVITGLVLSSPWVFLQIWAFVAAGLYPNEKRLVNVYLPFSAGLFIIGVVACQFLIMPRAVEALLWFNEWLGFEPDLRLNEWLGFALMLPVVFGLSFQTPVVMTFMNKIGVLSIEAMRNKRRLAWFVMAIIAAIITPTVDPLTMLSLWLPMGFLYEVGILLCVYQKNESPLDELDPSEREELVEV